MTLVFRLQKYYRLSVPVSKHLAETCFLVRPDNGSRFEVNVEIGVDSVVPEVIFFQHGVLELVASLFDIL
jgi:hypothetical protein